MAFKRSRVQFSSAPPEISRAYGEGHKPFFFIPDSLAPLWPRVFPAMHDDDFGLGGKAKSKCAGTFSAMKDPKSGPALLPAQSNGYFLDPRFFEV